MEIFTLLTKHIARQDSEVNAITSLKTMLGLLLTREVSIESVIEDLKDKELKLEK